MATPQEILEALRAVKYPGFSRDIVSFGLVKDIQVASAGVTVHLAPTTAQEDVVRQIAAAVEATVTAMPGVVGTVRVVHEPPAPAPGRRGPQAIPGIADVLAVASGKGGVG